MSKVARVAISLVRRNWPIRSSVMHYGTGHWLPPRCAGLNLTKLGERLNTHAEHSVMQLSESPSGAHHAGRIEVSAIEQTTRIEAVAAQLKNWRVELLEQRRQCVSHHV